MRKLSLLVALLVALAGCHVPSLIQAVGQGNAPAALGAFNPAMTLKGRVELSAFDLKPAYYRTPYKAQATVGEIATGATVSLIQLSTNQTVGTTLTDNSGNFVLQFGNQFKPTSGTIYYMEAVKGLGQNRAGVSAARLRTLVLWSNNAWSSISNATPGSGITISRSTTALSTITSLKQTVGTPVNANALIGSLQIGVPDSSGYDTFTPGSSGVAVADYDTVMGLVTDAITRDQDPLGVIIYDTVHFTFIRVTSGFTVQGLNPSQGPIGTTVTISGTNFDPVAANDIVKFNGIQAAVTGANSTALTVVVPLGATSGLVSVQIGSLVLAGVSFTVTANDGHNIFDNAGNLFVASQQSNELFSISPNGVLSRIASSSLLNSPQSLTYLNGYVYVACPSAYAVVKVDPTNGTTTNFAGPTGSYSFQRVASDPSGNLYAATQNAVFALSSSGTPTAYCSGFGNIQGIAFKNGGMYVLDSTNNAVYSVAATSSYSTFVTGLTNPTGFAFDTAGNLYVTDNTDGTIVKFDSSGLISSFASVPSPTGLAFNANGTFYTGNQTTNTIYQITLTGASRTYAQGIYDPVGLSIDASNNYYFVNRGASSYVEAPSGGFAASLASGFSHPNDFVRMSDGTAYVASQNSNSISKVSPSGVVSLYASVTQPLAIAYDATHGMLAVLSNANNYEVDTINLSTSAVTKYPNPLTGWQGKMIMDPAGNLYGVAQNGYNIWRVASGSLEITPHINASAYSTTPYGLFYEASGSMLVSFPSLNKVSRVNISTGVTTDLITSGLSSPQGVAEDPNGVIYVANSGNQSIVKFANGALSTVWSNDGTSASPLSPADVLIDSGGSSLYILNNGRNNVLQYNWVTQATQGIAIPQGGSIGYQASSFGAGLDATTGTLYIKYYRNGGGYVPAILTRAGALSSGTETNFAYGVAAQNGRLYEGYYWYLFAVNPDSTNYQTYTFGYYLPQSVAFDTAGNVLVGNNSSTIMRTFTSGASAGHTATYATMNNGDYIRYMAYNSVDGNLYAATTYYVYKVSSGGGTMTLYAPYNYGLQGIAFSASGTLFSVNGNNYNYLRQFNASSNAWTTVDTWCNQPRF